MANSLCLFLGVLLFLVSGQGKAWPAWLGDVNGDGQVTAKDIKAVIRAFLGLEKPPALFLASPGLWEKPFKKIHFTDIRYIVRLVAGLQPLQDIGTVVITMAGQAGQAGSEDGPTWKATLKDPYALIVSPEGVVLFCDASGQKIRRLTLEGRVETLAGSLSGYQDGFALSARFRGPYSLDQGRDGSLYIVDRFNHALRRLTPEGKVETVAGGTPGFRDGKKRLAQFRHPQFILRAPDDSFIIADTGNHSLRRVSPDGEVTTLAGTGAPGFADGPALLAQFNSPVGLAFDPQGNLYIADMENHAIRLLTPKGQVITLVGGQAGDQDGPPSIAQLYRPYGLYSAPQGGVYLADWGNEKVRYISPEGSVITIAGDGVPGYRDGPALKARFQGLMNIAVDARGHIWCADTDNQLIRKILP